MCEVYTVCIVLTMNSAADLPEAEAVSKCLPTYLPLMHQLRLLPPSRQAELVILISCQPDLMETLAVAAPHTHRDVQAIGVMPQQGIEALVKVSVDTA